MEPTQESNYHFSRLTAGAPREVLAPLGEALLAVAAQRRGEGGDAPALLRTAWLGLARWLLRTAGSELNDQQRLFLLGGALADEVTLKAPGGEVVTVALLPAPDYQALLGELEGEHAPYLLIPRRRIAVLAREQLAPLDLERPGRYRGPLRDEAVQVDPRRLAEDLKQRLGQVLRAQQGLHAAIRTLAELFQADKLGAALKPAQELAALAQRALDLAQDPVALAQLALPAAGGSGPDHLEHFQRQAERVLSGLAAAQADLSQALRAARDAAADLQLAMGTAGEQAQRQDTVVLTEQASRLIDKDYTTTNGVMVQALINDPQRTAWSGSRVLLSEHSEKLTEPLANCYATPANLERSIAKIDALHPNCFEHDEDGRPELPPVVIEPGTGVVRWYDDRFILGFVCSEPGRKGSRLSLSPLDIAVLRIYGQFLARGDIYDYRGDRLSGNFAADYAGEVESKAKVKFAGAEKKMTFVSSAEVKDAAGREEAVNDYVEFMFSAANGLAIPKRITARRIGVILRYCVVESAENTAALALRHLASYDQQVVREILLKLADRDKGRVVQLIAQAMESDKQLAARYRRELPLALREVMGREFAADAERAGLAGGKGAAPGGEGPGGDEGQPAEEHDYFDV